METLEQLKEQRKELEKQLNDNLNKIKAIQGANLFKKHGVEIGTPVAVNGKHGNISGSDDFWLYFIPLKKDGKPSNREQRIYSSDMLVVFRPTPKDI